MKQRARNTKKLSAGLKPRCEREDERGLANLHFPAGAGALKRSRPAGAPPQVEAFGLGRELLVAAIRYAYTCGCRHGEVLRGGETYRFTWGAEAVPKRRVVLTRGPGCGAGS